MKEHALLLALIFLFISLLCQALVAYHRFWIQRWRKPTEKPEPMRYLIVKTHAGAIVPSIGDYYGKFRAIDYSDGINRGASYYYKGILGWKYMDQND